MKKIIFCFLLLFTSTFSLVANFSVTISGASICPGECATLTATPNGGMAPYTYSWNPGTSSGSAINLCPVNTTTYTVSITDMMGGTGSATVVITVNPGTVITATTSNDVCPGDTATLTASGALTYTWIPAGSLNSYTGAIVNARPLVTTTYTITGTDINGCTAKTTTAVHVNPKPIADFTYSPLSLSASNPTAYFTDQSFGGSIVTWNWYFGDINNTTAIIQNPTFTYPNTIGCYSILLVVQNQFGCNDSVVNSICVTGIEELSTANNIVKIYPNPFNDNTTFIILSDKQNGNYSFELYGVLGKQVRSVYEISTKQFQVSRNGLPNGIYFYKIYDTENLIGIGKIIVE